MAPKRVLDPVWRAAWRTTWLALRPWNRHSLVLAILGTLYLLLGTLWLTTPPTPSRRVQLAALLHISDGSMTPWALLWMVTGTAALLSTRWPQKWSEWGYVALGMLAALWSAISLASLPAGAPPSVALGGTLVYAVFAVLIWAISGLTAPITAPPDVPPPPPDQQG